MVQALRRTVIIGVTLVAGAMARKAWQAYVARKASQDYRTRPKAQPASSRARRFYEGGFQPDMTMQEAADILGVRENASQEKVKEAHRRLMLANHPDTGGSDHIAYKINEAKDHLLR